jgi:hypothetical protein
MSAVLPVPQVLAAEITLVEATTKEDVPMVGWARPLPKSNTTRRAVRREDVFCIGLGFVEMFIVSI